MNEVAEKTNGNSTEGLFLSEDLSATEGRRFRIRNLEQGLPERERTAAIEAAAKRREHYISLLDPERDVRIGARCQIVGEEIHVSQSNLDRTYVFRVGDGRAVE